MYYDVRSNVNQTVEQEERGKFRGTNGNGGEIKPKGWMNHGKSMNHFNFVT